MTAPRSWPLSFLADLPMDLPADDLLSAFLGYVEGQGLELYPEQEQGILALFENKNLILNTPTGSGKSLVAMALHAMSWVRGRRSFYTCPIKALVNEKFKDWCSVFGPEAVGLITGDATVNPEAPIICCTAEILAFKALDDEAGEDFDVVMDEFHYYSDPDRGVSWQLPLLLMEKTRFLLMSATLGSDVRIFSQRLSELNGLGTEIVSSSQRPVPLNFEYRETALHETIGALIKNGQAPIYVVSFSQREAAEEAQNLLSVDFLTKQEKSDLQEELRGFSFSSPYGKEFGRFLRHGVGLHHAGLLPRYRVIVERLAKAGRLKVLSGTDTLGVGVNIPIRTVVLTKLCKFDGYKTSLLGVRDFLQMSGRAGRRGYDTEGYVAVQAPAHVIENQKLKLKAAGDPKKMRKLVLKTPPPRGFVMWTKETFERLLRSEPEPLVSRFRLSPGMVLRLLARKDGQGCTLIRRLARACHEKSKGKKEVREQAVLHFRSLRERDLISVIESSETGKSEIQVPQEVHEGLTLDDALSLYLLDALSVLEPQESHYVLDLLSVVEAILENPESILRRQLDEIKRTRIAEMKAEGMEYDERMLVLEELEYPQPLKEFVTETFSLFAKAHPWMIDESVKPKSIAREIFESLYTFSGYVKAYGIERSEGVLLRYLSQTVRVLKQTVPDRFKTEGVWDLIEYFESMVRSVDSSLLAEWEKWRTPGAEGTSETSGPTEIAPDLKETQKAQARQIRRWVHQALALWARHEFEELLQVFNNEVLDDGEKLSESWLSDRWELYCQDHQGPLLDTQGRHPNLTNINWTSANQAQVTHKLVDHERYNDWEWAFKVLFFEGELRVTLSKIGDI